MTTHANREQDPAEGSRETIEKELERANTARKRTAEKAQADLRKQVKEEVELPQKGAP
jgi:F0F1-type ATP synthase membrane subunit b/b'